MTMFVVDGGSDEQDDFMMAGEDNSRKRSADSKAEETKSPKKAKKSASTEAKSSTSAIRSLYRTCSKENKRWVVRAIPND